MLVKSVTKNNYSNKSPQYKEIVNKIVASTFDGFKNCQYIIDVLIERLESKRSSKLNIINVRISLKLNDLI